jgi:hypothetical protein
VLETGSHRIVEAKGNERIFMLDVVPIVDREYVSIYGRDITEVIDQRQGISPDDQHGLFELFGRLEIVNLNG